jgi:small-conductance mechanosensitive channel
MPSENATAAAAPRLHGTAHVKQVWTDSVQWVSAYYVEILIAIALAIGIVLILSAIRSLGLRACRNDRFGTGWPGVIGKVIAKTRLWFMVIFAAELVTGYADAPPAIARTIQTLFTIAAALQAALWARELVLSIIDRRASAAADSHAFGNAMGLIRVLVSIAFFAIALVLILDNLGVNVTGLVAGLGIGGIAIGLAAQGIFSDLFAALSMVFDKPFQIGDTINFDTTTGTVENIGLKTTRLRSTNGEMVVISNSKLLEKQLNNYSMFNHRRFTQTLTLIYQTPVDLLKRVPDIVAGVIAEHKEAKLIRCALSNFSPSSLDFEVLFDVEEGPPTDPFLIRSAIYVRILERFAEEGVEFAYPTQTTFTAAPDGKFVMPWPDGKH